ncbi:hypothetical protein HispidOSU_025946 [Sigmodon hispidus]
MLNSVGNYTCTGVLTVVLSMKSIRLLAKFKRNYDCGASYVQTVILCFLITLNTGAAVQEPTNVELTITVTFRGKD